MFSSTAIKHIRLLVLTESLPLASLALAETESFHPDTRAPEQDGLPGTPAHAYRDVFNQAQARLNKIANLIPLAETPPLDVLRAVEFDELNTLNTWLGQIWEQASAYEEAFYALDEAERLASEHEVLLDNFAELNIDLGRLSGRTRFLAFHVGVVPRENLRQLEDAAALAGHLLHVYLYRGETAHVVLVGPTDDDATSPIAAVLNAAGFQPLTIPPELDREPDVLRRELAARHREIAEQRAAKQQALTEWGATLHEQLLAARKTLILAEPLVTLDPSLRSAGRIAYLSGWVPARALADLEQRLSTLLDLPFDLAVRDPRPDERHLVPTLSVRHRWLQPFALLVNQYGIPAYGEIDPTPLFAVTFLLMFGSMFGDVGHGAVIAVAAWLARHKIPTFYRFGIFAGLSSMAFGVLFGSLFGYEDILHAVWMSPLHDPILMLEVALVWGVVFIIVACLLGIYNRLVNGDWTGALLERHGVINLLFYLAFLWGGYGLASGQGFGTLPALVASGSLLALAAFQWQHLHAPTGEKALVVVIETLDTVIVYLSNTLSFLRVAAFSLNHVALALAVFTLADMMGVFGHAVTIVLGNIFILVLEGGIVMIQVMRLQYYEGFSRYFSGTGHRFVPLRLRQPRPPSA